LERVVARARRVRARVLGQEIPGRVLLGDWAVRALLAATVGVVIYKFTRVYDEIRRIPEEERTLANVLKKLVHAL
jgi:hypothetical protein